MGVAPGNTQGKERLTMPDDHGPKISQGFATRMSHAGRAGTRAHGFVNPAVHRGSTVLMPSAQARRDFAKDRFNRVMTYGTAGGPTRAGRAACWWAPASPP
jgi:cystathionine beta-lyase